MPNSLGDGFVRVTYTGLIEPHHAIIPVNLVGDPAQGVEPDVLTAGNVAIPVTSGMLGWLNYVAPFFPATTTFGLAEAYKIDPDTQEHIFLFGWNLGTSGEGTGDRLVNGQLVMTLKTRKGGRINVYLMEPITEVDVKVFPPAYAGDARLVALEGYLVSADNIVIGRDDAYPFAVISVTTKSNDALRRRRGL